MHIAHCHSSTLIRLWPWERKRPKFENKQPKIQGLKTEILECVSGLYDKKRVGRVVSEPIIAPGGGSQCTFVNIHSAHSLYNFKNVKSRWKLRCDGGAGVCAIRAPHQEAIPCQHCDVIRSVQHFASKLAFMPCFSFSFYLKLREPCEQRLLFDATTLPPFCCCYGAPFHCDKSALLYWHRCWTDASFPLSLFVFTVSSIWIISAYRK